MTVSARETRDGPVTGPEKLLRRVERFIYREARLADEHDYDAWEALWTDDALYWVPAGGDLTAPSERMSVIYDNRSRISTRLAQLRTGRRHAQDPPSQLRRVISNIELIGEEDGDILAAANFIAAESRERGLELWAGRVTYRLRRAGDDALLMSGKQVLLVNRDQPLPTLGFLI